jgi:hypothetical protein
MRFFGSVSVVDGVIILPDGGCPIPVAVPIVVRDGHRWRGCFDRWRVTRAVIHLLPPPGVSAADRVRAAARAVGTGTAAHQLSSALVGSSFSRIFGLICIGSREILAMHER